MAESFNTPAVGQSQPTEDNEQRIDGDGQEVNALRFLGAGGPPAPPPPAITPVSTVVSQPLPSQHQQQQSQPPPTPLQPPPSSQHQHAQQAMPTSGGYDYSDPSSYNSMQMPPVPMAGPYGMPGQVPGMMMMPPYNYMYPPPQYFMPGPYQSMPPSAPSSSNSSQFLAMLNVLRVKDPKFYREWYKKYNAHKRNPNTVPFPQIPGFPNVGAQSSLPFGRSRQDSTRSSVNGESFRHNESFANPDFPHIPGGGANTSMSHAYSRGHRQQPRSGRTSVNGDYRAPPEDDLETIDGDMPSLGGIGGNSLLHSTHYHSDRDRPPTQSGRSSTIGEPYRLQPGEVYGYPDQQTDSLGYDNSYRFEPIADTEHEQVREPSPRRMTPMKFSTFHCIATMSPLGHLIRIKNSGTVIEFLKMKQFVGHLPEYKEMESFPGPLIQGSTHKNTVIQFCRRKIKDARSNSAQLDKENYILLWEFLMLMLRQNGMVVGSDIAELLLTSEHQEETKKVAEVEDVRDDTEGGEDGEENEGASALETPPMVIEPRDEEKLVQQFCDHLLYGHKKDALDFAMDNGLWGHALFFASKMDERSYGNVLARFANGIALNSPLQTLYHIMCGKQPASVTSCADESFGDWKPHLAMLLSNSGYKHDVEHKAILTLGDTLASRNHLFAAQFCYLMGHEEFRKDSRLGPLLGYSASADNVLEATQMTEVYEFARKLADQNFSLGLSFLHSKLEYAKSLVSHGFVQEALAYCEEITKTLKSRKIEDAELKLCTHTLQISERIAVADESDTANTTWVDDLRKMIADPVHFGSVPSRKLSLVSSSHEQGSDQMSNASQSHIYHQQIQQQPPVDTYDPYMQMQNTSTLVPDSTSSSNTNFSQFDTAVASSSAMSASDPDATFSGVRDLPQDSWNSSQQMNGGLHLSSPPVSYNGSQQLQQPPMYTNSAAGQYGMNGGSTDLNQQPMSSGYGTSDGYDNLSTAAIHANNNHLLYNPNDPSQNASVPNHHDYGRPKEADHMTSVSKKKSVRFEDEHEERHADVECSLGNGVQSVLRSRVSSSSTNDPSDLKSAMKVSNVNANVDRSEIIRQMSCTKDENYVREQNQAEEMKSSLLEVEYKSTYPIDEPIESNSIPRLASCNFRPSSASTSGNSTPLLPSNSPNFDYHNHSKSSKTFPVDKECCDINEPCEDHDDFGGNDGEAVENGTHTPDISSHFSGYENKTEDFRKNSAPMHSLGGHEKKTSDKKKSGKENKGGDQQQQEGWFSGLFKKMSLKPKNQMILPDDKNPTIVWDPKQQRWVSTIGDGEDDLAPAGPPPKDSDLMGMGKSHAIPNGPSAPPPNMNMMQQQHQHPPNANNSQAPYQAAVPPALHSSLPNPNNAPSQNHGMMNVSQGQPQADPMNPGGMPPTANNSMNKYKLQRSRNIKNSYVDVFNPNASKAPNEASQMPVNNMSTTPHVPNLFIPPPTNAPGDGPVSFLTAPTSEEGVSDQDQNAVPQAPPMFNPAQFQNPGYSHGQ